MAVPPVPTGAGSVPHPDDGGSLFRFLNILLLCLVCGTLFAGASAFADGERIVQILVKGNQRIEQAAIMNVVKLKVGDYLYPDKVDADIRAIYKIGQFQDVSADATPSGKGMVLTYIVDEKPIVRDISYIGNKELSAEKLKEADELKRNAVFSERDLARSVKKIKKAYADEGYYLAEVNATTEKLSHNGVRVVYRITEGKKVLIKTIQFEGNKAFTRRQLKKVMETGEKWFMSWLTGAGTYKEDVLRNDLNQIADLYFNNGYINVRVGEPKVTLLPDKSGLVVTIGITEGDQYRTGKIDFRGDMLEPAAELAKKISLKPGDVFSRGKLRSDIFTLTDLYADKGYAFANVNPLTRPNPETKTIDITFDFEKGEKVYINRINIAGNTKTRDKVIRRELKLAEGDQYSSTALKKSKQALMNLGFFEEANLSTAKGSADNRLNLDVAVKEKSTGTFSIGAGYSSLDGLIGQGSVSQSNFLGLGLKANLSASIGGRSQTYNLGLTDPYFLDSRWTVGGDIYRTERDYIDFTRRVTGADIKAGYPLSDTLNTFWVYKFEGKEIYNESAALVDEYRTNPAIKPDESSTTSSVYASLTRNTTDYHLDPSTGMINTLSIEYAGLGGSNKFVRYLGDTTVFFPIKWGSVLSLRGSLGYIQKTSSTKIPIDERFYLGGISTLRGFESRTVSPYFFYDAPKVSGQAYRNVSYLGGNKQAVFNTELVFPILKDAGLKGVVFLDAGNSYGDDQQLFSSFLASYGFGFRWASPMGPLRIEYGIPFNPRPEIDNKSGRLEFSIGGFF